MDETGAELRTTSSLGVGMSCGDDVVDGYILFVVCNFSDKRSKQRRN